MSEQSKIGRTLYRLYIAVGVAAMGFLCGGVIFTVIMRYCFGTTFTFLEELLTLVFAFTAFWCIGACALEHEHVVIDFLYSRFPPKMKRVVDVINDVLVIAMLTVMDYYTFRWVAKAGKTISNGMRVKYVYIYGAMPIGVTVSLLWLVYKLVCDVRGRRTRAWRKEDDIL